MMPFHASVKPYFSEPYVCMLLSKAKLLVLNLRQALADVENVNSYNFEEINTLVSQRYNFKLVI